MGALVVYAKPSRRLRATRDTHQHRGCGGWRYCAVAKRAGVVVMNLLTQDQKRIELDNLRRKVERKKDEQPGGQRAPGDKG